LMTSCRSDSVRRVPQPLRPATQAIANHECGDNCEPVFGYLVTTKVEFMRGIVSFLSQNG
jgi:hypothetical protein